MKRLLWLLLYVVVATPPGESSMMDPPINRRIAKQQANTIISSQDAAKVVADLRRQGYDEVGHTKESAFLRDYRLQNLKKKRGGVFLHRKNEKTDLGSVLFPGVSPEVYQPHEEVPMFTDVVNSKRTQVPFDFYDLFGCPAHKITESGRQKRQQIKKNLGALLQGFEQKPAPYAMKVKEDVPCTPLCQRNIKKKELEWLRQLIERQYRIHMTLDSLPVLIRSRELNFVVRGYPIGFRGPQTYTGLKEDEFFLYNHLKFTISFKSVENSDDGGGVHITGFDVQPFSINHTIPESGLTPVSELDTCNGKGAEAVINDPATFLKLKSQPGTAELPVVYSYEVKWEETKLLWADRWDVYLIGTPDDDIHWYASINSLIVVLFLTGAISTITIRTLRKDIAGYNEMHLVEGGAQQQHKETGWKLVHRDVFRPPTTSPMIFSILVGTGMQIGSALFFTVLCFMIGWINPMEKGQTLTAILVLYALCGSVAGYVSARMYKFCCCEDSNACWRRNMLLTAAGLPGVLIGTFMVLNVFLNLAGAATAVGSCMILAIFALWECVNTPLVFVGAFLGFRAPKVEVPSPSAHANETVVREIPSRSRSRSSDWYYLSPHLITFLLGGILPFMSFFLELAFIMTALWLHQFYYMVGFFLLVAILILVATCAEVSIILTYLQLCMEDHRWWWKSFFNCASAGFYLFLYSLWFQFNRMDLAGVLSVVVYITYMSMISLLLSLFCGAVGVLSSFWFCRQLYGALTQKKLDL